MTRKRQLEPTELEDGTVLPAIVKVGPLYYRIVTGHLDANLAETLHDECLIRFDVGLSVERVKEVLLHELAHCIHYVYRRELVNPRKGVKVKADELDEILAQTYGMGWTALMRDNPQLVLFIMEGVFYGTEIDPNTSDEGGDPGNPDDLAGNAGYL